MADREGERLIGKLQESFAQLVEFNHNFTKLLLELQELNDPRVKKIFDKYQVVFLREEK